ncbi:hypothetical protein D3C77_626600 [compost metagenome]
MVGINQCFGGQEVVVVIGARGVGGIDNLGIQQLRQALGNLQVNIAFVFGGLLASIEQHHALLAVCRSAHGAFSSASRVPSGINCHTGLYLL